VGLSVTEHGSTRLTENDVAQSDWLTGTVAQAYGLPATLPRDERLVQIALRDHIGRLEQEHPSVIEVGPDLASARTLRRPLRLHRVACERARDHVVLRSIGTP